MGINSKFVILIASCAMLTTPSNAGAAKRETKPHHRHYAERASSCPIHKNAYGDLIDCRGWRLRDNATGWDNTCFHLDYLSSQFACASPNGQH